MIETQEGEIDRSPPEFVDLFPKDRGYGKLVKVYGSSRAGTGLRTDNFEIVEITDDSLRVIFGGELLSLVLEKDNGKGEYHQYQFVDLDNDDFKEIIEDTDFCQLEWKNKEWQKVLCDTKRSIVYKFNGTK